MPNDWEYQLQREILLYLELHKNRPMRLVTKEQIDAARQKMILIPLNVIDGKHVQKTYLESKRRNNPSELSHR